ncbi:MAG: hypothetical protein WDN75_12015 [Bacteroidota bacterium]
MSSYGQEMDTTLRMSIQVGTGWTHYYNNLVIGHNSVKNDYLGSSLRIMWEPEHRLSIGVETGYYKLYRVGLETGDGHVDLSVIPVMANFRMRILKNFYVTGGTGVVIMNSDVTNTGNSSDKTTVISYSNVQLSGLYLYHLTQQLAVGGEVKFLWIDKTNDFVHSVQGIVSWRF